MEKQNLPACPVETTLSLIGNRWKVLIIRDLLSGKKRFGELKNAIGNISQKVLTSNLKDMKEAGLITRTVYPEVPPRVEYELTETGLSLNTVLESMVDWGTEYKNKMER
ncbi:winged helix-turn-helix transcriptional regulator [uncultured Robinsoniella sp.]|uniref:winged helix-turn-helix transcriptional regulator n=1 Tax=uncultured Robinsoniella sp. TaxID=904190 RepID=UPI00374F7BF1